MGSALVDFELDVLRMLAGEDVPGMKWGAAMSAALESLTESGYARLRVVEGGLRYEITEEGFALLIQGAKQDPPP